MALAAAAPAASARARGAPPPAPASRRVTCRPLSASGGAAAAKAYTSPSAAPREIASTATTRADCCSTARLLRGGGALALSGSASNAVSSSNAMGTNRLLPDGRGGIADMRRARAHAGDGVRARRGMQL